MSEERDEGRASGRGKSDEEQAWKGDEDCVGSIRCKFSLIGVKLPSFRTRWHYCRGWFGKIEHLSLNRRAAISIFTRVLLATIDPSSKPSLRPFPHQVSHPHAQPYSVTNLFVKYFKIRKKKQLLKISYLSATNSHQRPKNCLYNSKVLFGEFRSIIITSGI